jgi:hypothetical protein
MRAEGAGVAGGQDWRANEQGHAREVQQPRGDARLGVATVLEVDGESRKPDHIASLAIPQSWLPPRAMVVDEAKRPFSYPFWSCREQVQ